MRDVLREWSDVSHESVRHWYPRIIDTFPQPRRRKRKSTAMDLDTREILAVYLLRRSGCGTLRFLRKVMRYCTDKPLVLVDRGLWYPWALERHGLPWRDTFGKRNPIEQWFGIVNQRMKGFWNRFPHNSSIMSTYSWLLTCTAICNS
ncbi:MAG: hypothetical protein ACE5KV_01030 [Thermoplasmata archaeon]